MHKIVFFFPEKNLLNVPALPKIFRPVSQNTLIFLFGHNKSFSGLLSKIFKEFYFMLFYCHGMGKDCLKKLVKITLKFKVKLA